jgi:hypothetical protein
VISGQQDGYLEPCGCAEGQYGGLIRRYDFVERLRKQNGPTVLLDLGSLIKDPAASRGGVEQTKIKFAQAIKALSVLHYGALALSVDDLKLGVGEVLSQFLLELAEGSGPAVLAANVEAAGGFETIIRPSLVLPAGPVKFGVTAVVDPEALAKLIDPEKDALLPVVKRPEDVLPKILSDLESTSDVQVLLVQGPAEQARKLGEAYPGFDVVVSTSVYPDPPQDPDVINGGKTLIVTVGRKGKFVGAIGVFDGSDKERLRYQRVTLGSKFDGAGEPMKAVVQDEYREKLKNAGVVENFPRHDYVNGAPGAVFVGAESCRECHPNTYARWASTKHAQAFEALLHDPKPNTIYDAECVTCHTTGFGYNSGWVSESQTPALKGNQCENCHGPGSKHIAEPDNLAFRKPMALTATFADKGGLCIRCHDEDNSPHFNDFSKFWSQIVHKGMDDYKDPKVHQPARTAGSPNAEAAAASSTAGSAAEAR